MTTTSEFIIGHSADDATERKGELRKIAWASLAAILLHLVIGYFLATFSGLFFSDSTPVEEEDKPVELTMINLPADQATPVPKNAMFMETDESRASKEAPNEKTFESNVNSIAATESTVKGDAPLPSQEGKERPFTNLDTHDYSLAMNGVAPQPSAPPQEKPQETPQPSPYPSATPVETDQLAMLTSTPKPTPVPTPPQQRQQPRSAYRPMREKNRIAGSISNRGISSVNALGTPLGRYEKIMKDAIGSRWYAYMEQRREMAAIGTLQVRFFIDRSGHVKNLKVTENTSNETFANICLQAVLEAQFPPIPEDLAATLPAEGLEIEGMNFIIYPN